MQPQFHLVLLDSNTVVSSNVKGGPCRFEHMDFFNAQKLLNLKTSHAVGVYSKCTLQIGNKTSKQLPMGNTGKGPKHDSSGEALFNHTVAQSFANRR